MSSTRSSYQGDRSTPVREMVKVIAADLSNEHIGLRLGMRQRDAKTVAISRSA